MSTRAPWLSRVRAMASPIPRLDPVTTAVVAVRSNREFMRLLEADLAAATEASGSVRELVEDGSAEKAGGSGRHEEREGHKPDGDDDDRAPARGLLRGGRTPSASDKDTGECAEQNQGQADEEEVGQALNVL